MTGLLDMPREIIGVIADNMPRDAIYTIKDLTLVCTYTSSCGLMAVFARRCYWWPWLSQNLTNIQFAYNYADKIEWRFVRKIIYEQLSEDVVDLHWDYFNREMVCRFSKIGVLTMEKIILYSDCKLTLDLISRFQPNLIAALNLITNVEYARSLNWELICKYHKLPEELMRRYVDFIHWGNVSQYQTLSEDFMTNYSDKLCGYRVAKYQKLSYDFMTQHREFAYYRVLVSRQKFPQEVLSRAARLREHVYNHKYYECDNSDHRRTWCWICNRLAVVELTDRLVHELAVRFDFNYITRYQQLDEEFMERYADKLNWYNVSQFQELSTAFIEKYRDKLCHKRLRARGLISFTQ